MDMGSPQNEGDPEIGIQTWGKYGKMIKLSVIYLWSSWPANHLNSRKYIFQDLIIWYTFKQSEKYEISFGGIPNSRKGLSLQICLKHAAKPSAGNTWACSKASQTFSGTFSSTLLNLTWLCTKASRNLLRNLLRTWLCTKASQTFSGTVSGTLFNLTGLCTKPPRPSPEPSSEPCWTWPGSAPKRPRPSPEPSELFPEPRWTWPSACTSAHRS